MKAALVRTAILGTACQRTAASEGVFRLTAWRPNVVVQQPPHRGRCRLSTAIGLRGTTLVLSRPGGGRHLGVHNVAVVIGADVPGGVTDVIDGTAQGDDVGLTRQRPVHRGFFLAVVVSVVAVVISLIVVLDVLLPVLPLGVTPIPPCLRRSCRCSWRSPWLGYCVPKLPSAASPRALYSPRFMPPAGRFWPNEPPAAGPPRLNPPAPRPTPPPPRPPPPRPPPRAAPPSTSATATRVAAAQSTAPRDRRLMVASRRLRARARAEGWESSPLPLPART